MLGPNSLLSSLSRTGGDRLLASIWMSGAGFGLPSLGLCAAVAMNFRPGKPLFRISNLLILDLYAGLEGDINDS